MPKSVLTLRMIDDLFTNMKDMWKNGYESDYLLKTPSFLRNVRLLNFLHNKNKKKVNKMGQKCSVVLGKTVSFIDFATSKVIEGKVDGIDVIVTDADGSAYRKSIVSLFNNTETAKVKLRRDLQKQIKEQEKSLAELRKQFDKV